MDLRCLEACRVPNLSLGSQRQQLILHSDICQYHPTLEVNGLDVILNHTFIRKSPLFQHHRFCRRDSEAGMSTSELAP